jgi:hypothetical protein
MCLPKQKTLFGETWMLTTMTARTTIAAILIGLSMSAHAIADSPKRVDIPAGELRQALLQVSEQFGTDIVFSPGQVQGFKTQGAHGELTTEQAITKLQHLFSYAPTRAAPCSSPRPRQPKLRNRPPAPPAPQARDLPERDQEGKAF